MQTHPRGTAPPRYHVSVFNEAHQSDCPVLLKCLSQQACSKPSLRKKDLVKIDSICISFTEKGFGDDTVAHLQQRQGECMTAAEGMYELWKKHSTTASKKLTVAELKSGTAELTAGMNATVAKYEEFKNKEMSAFIKNH